MPSIISNYKYDVFISYRQKDNRDGWVSDFVKAIKKEIDAALKEDLSIYFDENLYDGLDEIHDVNSSLNNKIQCLIFIPIVSQTYCDPKSFAWKNELLPFLEFARSDEFGLEIDVRYGNVIKRVLPVRIHELIETDKTLIENELGATLRPIDFIYRESGVNRPLLPTDNRYENLLHTDYRNQLNKVANAVKEIMLVLTQSENPLQKSSNIPKSISPEKSIAVLAFENVSNDPEQVYFCNGLADEIINILARLGKLKVAARTSSFSLSNQNLEIANIGHKLNVKTILEGSVRKVGNRLRITAQLINVEDGFQLWSNRYDREIMDIFDIQDEIALSITNALKLELLGSEKSEIIKHGTDNTRAYEMYLKGLQSFHKFTPESLKKAIQFYKSAIEIHPKYANAFAGLVPCYHISWMFNYLPSEECIAEVQYAANKSMELDSSLSESQMAMGKLKFWFEFNFLEAKSLFYRSLELNPNNPDTLGQLGILLAILGNEKLALTFGAKAKELDPFSPLANVDYGWVQFLCGVNDDYLTHTLEMIDMFPNFWAGYHMAGSYYWKHSQFDKAIDLYETALNLNYSPLHLSSLGYLYSMKKDKKKAQLMLDKLIELNKNTDVASFNFVVLYTGLNDIKSANQYIEKAKIDRGGHFPFLNTYRRFLIPSFNHNPKFLKVMEELGMPNFD